MLWMITDFSKTPSVDSAYSAVVPLIDAGLKRLTLRTQDNFSEKQLYELSSKILSFKPETEIFVVENINLAETLGIKNIHLRGGSQMLVAPLLDADPAWRICVSTHAAGEMDSCFNAGAAFCFYSPLFEPFSKQGDCRQHVAPLKRKNLFLLGGINRDRAETLIKQGFYDLAGISLFYGEGAADTIRYLNKLIEHEEHYAEDDTD